MDSRRLVVWLSAGILGFQGGTLVLDLIHCSVLSWLYVRRYGLELVLSAETVRMEQRPPEGQGQAAASLAPERALATDQPQPPAQPPALHHPPSLSPQPRLRAMPQDPTEVFCSRPRSRVDAAVGQGLSILAGLALGGSVGGGGKSEAP